MLYRLSKKREGEHVIGFVQKRRFCIEEISLAGARQLVRELPFQDIEGSDLPEIREKLGVSQLQLADFIGVHENTVYRYEMGINGVPDTLGLTITGLCFLRIAHEAEKNRQARDGVIPRLEKTIFEES